MQNLFHFGTMPEIQTFSMKRFILGLILCLMTLPVRVSAQNTDLTNSSTPDSVVISLLTCTPGNLVYDQYGHTAIRVREVNTDRPSDWVFNYGTFSFDQPHFLWNFIMGKGLYELSVEPYAFFYSRYYRERRGVEEQVLNLTPEEERNLVNALSRNLQPENARYRYNFFYDNCTTRAVDMITAHLKGKVIWNDSVGKGETIRDIVHRYSENSPWYKFGQDLLLGAEADQPASCKVRQFSPMITERMAEQAQIEENGTIKPLVGTSVSLLPNLLKAEKPYPITPMGAFGILLAFTLILSVYEIRQKKYYWGYDALLMLAQGLTGCIVTFLFLFSPHPTVGSNWLVVLFNPFPLLYFPWLMKQASVGKRAKGLYVQKIMLLGTLLLMWFGPQEFPIEINLIVAILALRLVVHDIRTVK